jgi:hypothetical protein
MTVPRSYLDTFSGWGDSPTLKPSSNLLPPLLGLNTGAINTGSGTGLSLNNRGLNALDGLSVNRLGNNNFGEGLSVDWNTLGGGWGASGMGAAGGGNRGLFSSFLQQRYADGTTGGGYGSAGLGILQGLGSAYMGMKQYSLAKDTLNENKKQFNLNYGAQANITNASLEDRQKRRNLENPNSMAAADYMNKYGIKAA